MTASATYSAREAVFDAATLLLWEAAYGVACACVRRALASPPLRARLSAKLSDKLRVAGGSYAVSFAHAALMSARGVAHLLDFWNAPPNLRVQPPLSAAERLHHSTLRVVQSNRIFASYLLDDLLHVLLAWPRLGGLDVVAHHAAFLLVATLGRLYFVLPFAFGWLTLGELSTVVLDVRWFCIHCGYGDSKAMTAINALFAASFFALRVAVYGAGAVDLLRHARALTRPPPWARLLLLCSISAGFALNVLWFAKILRVAFQPRTTRRNADERHDKWEAKGRG